MLWAGQVQGYRKTRAQRLRRFYAVPTEIFAYLGTAWFESLELP